MKFTACDRCHINTQGSDIKSVRLENTMRDLCPACVKSVREVFEAVLKVPAKLQWIKAPVLRKKAGICDSCGDRSIDLDLVRGECPSCRESRPR